MANYCQHMMASYCQHMMASYCQQSLPAGMALARALLSLRLLLLMMMQALAANTQRHMEGRPAQHVLMCGPQGSGKSWLLWHGTQLAGERPGWWCCCWRTAGPVTRDQSRACHLGRLRGAAGHAAGCAVCQLLDLTARELRCCGFMSLLVVALHTHGAQAGRQEGWV